MVKGRFILFFCFTSCKSLVILCVPNLNTKFELESSLSPNLNRTEELKEKEKSKNLVEENKTKRKKKSQKLSDKSGTLSINYIQS